MKNTDADQSMWIFCIFKERSKSRTSSKSSVSVLEFSRRSISLQPLPPLPFPLLPLPLPPYPLPPYPTLRSAVAWWLMPQTPHPEVGCSSPTQVKPRCVLEQGTLFYSPKVLVIPRKRWLRPNMTEKLFTGTLRINQSTNQPTLPYPTLPYPTLPYPTTPPHPTPPHHTTPPSHPHPPPVPSKNSHTCT